MKEVDPKKVEELKNKAKGSEKPKPQSDSTIETVWYGPQTDNERASGAGEF